MGRGWFQCSLYEKHLTVDVTGLYICKSLSIIIYMLFTMQVRAYPGLRAPCQFWAPCLAGTSTSGRVEARTPPGVPGQLVNGGPTEKVGNAVKKKTCRAVITAGFRPLKGPQGEGELDYSTVFQRDTEAWEWCDGEVGTGSMYRRLKHSWQ